MRRAIALLAIATVLVATSNAAAQAAPAPTTGSTSTTFSASQAVPGALAAQDVIDCTIQINYPHKSAHNPGQVNITATWQCTQAVAHLDITMYMFRGGLFVTQAGPFNNNGGAYVQGTVNSSCVTGSYQGIAIGNVTFPPGYVPPTGQESVYTPNVYISC